MIFDIPAALSSIHGALAFKVLLTFTSFENYMHNLRRRILILRFQVHGIFNVECKIAGS